MTAVYLSGGIIMKRVVGFMLLSILLCLVACNGTMKPADETTAEVPGAITTEKEVTTNAGEADTADEYQSWMLAHFDEKMEHQPTDAEMEAAREKIETEYTDRKMSVPALIDAVGKPHDWLPTSSRFAYWTWKTKEGKTYVACIVMPDEALDDNEIFDLDRFIVYGYVEYVSLSNKNYWKK